MTRIILRADDDRIVIRDTGLRGPQGAQGPPGDSNVPDATASIKGKIQLTGDLGGTAQAPVVRGVRTLYVAPYGSSAVADYKVGDEQNAHIEINQALVAAEAFGDTIVELLGGRFILGASVIPRSHTWLRGQGMWGQTVLTTTENAGFAPLDNYDEYPHESPWSFGMVTDLELDGSNISRTNPKKCFNSAASYKCQTLRVYAHDSTATGLGMDDFTAGWIDNCLVENCGFSSDIEITDVTWSTNTFTFETASPHGYTGAVKASATLTATSIANGDTVTIDQRVYTFKTTLTGAAFEVNIGGSTATALDNLLKAVNLTGVAGTDYGTGTTIHPTVTATTNTDTTQLFVAKSSGSTSNSMVSTETGANMSFGSSTFTGGTTGSIIIVTGMVPVYYNGRFVVSSIVDANTFTVTTTDNSGSLNLATNPGAATTLGRVSDSLIGHNGFGIASGSNETEATIVSNCIAIGNQNNNFLIEADNNNTSANASYIFTNCISINAGQVGFQNTGTPNTQFNDCYDFGSPMGGQASSTAQTRDITAASWSGGIATFTTASEHNYSATGEPDGVVKKVQIANMYPDTYNGYYTVTGTPTPTTFTVSIPSNPGTALQFGQASYVFHDVSGSSFNDSIFSHNLNWGIRVPVLSSGVMVKDTTIKYAYNYGLQTGSGNSQLNGVRIHDSGRQGIRIVTSNNNVVPLSHMDISDTFVWNSNKRGIGTGIGIEIDAGTGEPIGNVTLSNVQTWDDQDTPTQDYGLIVRSGGSVGDIYVSGGDFSGNGIQGILDQDDSGAVKIFNVGGVNPIGKQTLGNVSGSVTFDSSLANYFTCTLTNNITAVMPESAVSGTIITIQFTQDATGGRTLSLPANAQARASGVGLVLSTAANATDVVTFIWDGTKWQEKSRDLDTTLISSRGGINTTAPAASNVVPLVVTQSDTTNNPNAGTVTNAGAGHGLQIIQNGVLASNKHALFIDSNAIQVTSELVRVRQDNASSTAGVISIQQDGTGRAVYIDNNNTGVSIEVDQNATSASSITGVLIDVDNAGAGGAIGLDVASASGVGGGTVIGLRIAAPIGGTSNYALQLSDTGGTSSGGITFGTDTSLYRSAAGTLTVSGTLVARVQKRVATLVDAATVTPDTDAFDGGKLTSLSQSTLLGNPTGTPTAFQQYILRVKSASAQSLTYDTQYRGSTGVPLPSATTGSNKTDYFGFQWNSDDSKWDLIAVAQGY